MLCNTLTTKPQPASEIPRIARFPDLIITIRPIGADKYEVQHAGRVLVRSSTEPFLAAARALLAEGWPPGAVLAMRHRGEPDFALRGKLGQVAKVTVENCTDGTPRLRRWKPSPYSAVSPPVRVFEPQLPYPRAVTPARIRRVAS
jgi:hypothetical protein